MANLNTKTLAVGVLDILSVDGGISGNKQIVDGDGTASNLYIDGINLGIGQSSPTYPLHISSASDYPIVAESTDSASGLYLKDNSTSAFCGPVAIGNDLQLRTANTARITIKSDGKVGIGVTPATKFQVESGVRLGNLTATSAYDDHIVILCDSGTAYEGGLLINNCNDATAGNCSVKLNVTGSGVGADTADFHVGLVENSDPNNFDAPGKRWFWCDGPTGNVMFNSGGKVGIGTDAPGVKLDVRGRIYSGGPLYYGKSDVAIASGVLNITSTQGPVIHATAQQGVGSDDADTITSITIDGAEPVTGSIIYLTRGSNDVITLTLGGSAVSTIVGYYADDVGEATQTGASAVISNSYEFVQLMYTHADRWVIMNPGSCRFNV